MLNINGKVLDELDANEYYLLSILLNYGKQSRPDNDVLLHKTKWGLQKLQRTKKSLIKKGYIVSKAQFKNKERGRSSNLYVIVSPLVSKYNGNQLDDFKLDENKLDDFKLDENKLDENHTSFKVLKSINIETNKLLKKEESTHAQEKVDIEIQEPKIQNSEKEKNSAKKEKGLEYYQDGEMPPHDLGYQSAKKRVAKQKGSSWSQLDINLSSYKDKLPQHWTKDFTEEIIDFWRYCEEKKGVNWGTVRTIKSQVETIENYLLKFSEQQISDSIKECIKNGNVSFNPQWTINRIKKEKDEQERNNKAKRTSKFGKFGASYAQRAIDRNRQG